MYRLPFWFTRDASGKGLHNKRLHTMALRATTIRGLAVGSPGRIAPVMLVPPGLLRRHANAEKETAKTHSNRHVLPNVCMSD